MSAAEPLGVLFLCTGNSARSILAEAQLARLGSPHYCAYSAGSQPKSAPHPVALQTLADRGYDTTVFRSKSWSEFAADGAPKVDIVLTVCGNAAAEECPVWPGHPLGAHWGVEDPAALEGPVEAQRVLFEKIYEELFEKVEALARLNPHEVSRESLRASLEALGSSSP